MYKVITVISSLALLLLFITAGVRYIQYDRDVAGHLKLAADANNLERAQGKLQVAVDGMERRGLCNGKGDNCFTSVLYRTPEDDVGYWRANIEDTLIDIVIGSGESPTWRLTDL